MSTEQLSKMVGAPAKRKEDPRLIAGEGAFTDDVQLRGMVYMAVLRSPHAHARLLRVDASEAARQPEVLAVLTGDQVKQRCGSPLPVATIGTEGMNLKSRWPMATEVVNMVGEPVAAVVATSREAAHDALEMVDVEYELLPAVMDLEKALQEGSPLVHEDLGTNLCFETSGKGGDPDRAFHEADGVVSVRIEQPRVIPNTMEPRAVLASYERGTGNLTVWDTTQEPHDERGTLANILGLAENKVRVIAVDVGGGFGAKMTTYPESYIAAIFSMQLAKPVKWLEDRQEHFMCTSHGRGQVQYAEAAYGNDGTLMGLRVRFYADLGAYIQRSSHLTMSGLSPLGSSGMYGVKNVAWTSYGVYTNKMPVGPYRGYGRNESTVTIERLMDVIARKLNMNPIDLRRKNFISRDEFPYTTPTGVEYDSGDYEAALDQALQMAGYDQLREEQRRLRERGSLMGIGVVTSVESAGFGPTGTVSSKPGYESATIRVDPAGKMTLLTGSSPHGQGLETVFAQLVADELGVPLDDVEVLHGDTAVIPRGMGTFGSRSLVVGGTAAIKAADRVREKATQIAAALLQIDPEHVVLESGKFYAEDIPDRYVTWAEVGKEAYQVRHMPMDMERGLEATAYWEPLALTFPFGANVAAVRIDKDTGEVKLTKYVLVDDCGTVINPLLLDGQIHGSLAQGIGPALMEEAVYDESGQLLTGSFMDYAMPFADEFPPFELGRTVTPTPHNPMGAKGGAETCTNAATCTIANAVVDALSHLGVTHIDIPITAEKVWRILRGKGVTS